MSDVHLADDMTEAERHFFESGGDVSDALIGENKDTPPPAPVPGEGGSPAPGTPAAQSAPSAGAPGAGEDDDEDDEQPGQQQGQQPGQQQQPRRVNYNKFRRAEERATAAEGKLQEQALRNAKTEERLNLLMEALNGPSGQQQPQEEQDPKPDKNRDIFAYSEWLERQVDRLGQRLDGFDQMVNTGQSEMNLQQRYFEDMNSYAGREPNFVAAYAHLFKSRDAELAYYHPEMTPQQRNQIIIEEERSLYKSAYEGNRSAAEMIFNLARVRGFVPPAQQQQPNGQQQPGQGQQQQPRVGGTPIGGVPQQGRQPQQQQPGNGTTQQMPQPQPQTAAELVEAIKRGQGASLSLSQGAGGTGIELTPQMLGDMNDEQFEAVYEEVRARGRDREREFFGS